MHIKCIQMNTYTNKIHTDTYTHTHSCTVTHTRMHAHTHTHTHTHICVCMHTKTHTRRQACDKHTYKRTNLLKCTSHQALNHSSAVLMEQMDLIHYEQPRQLGQTNVTRSFMCHHIPFLWCCHYQLV